MLRACQFLTILTSKSLSLAGAVWILRSSTSKSALNPRCFNDLNFQIALVRRRGANFVDILGSRSFATPVFRTYLCEPSKRQNYGKTQHFAQFLPAKISQVSHLCCKTSLLSNIGAARPTGNFQYSRKLELLNFLWSGDNCTIVCHFIHGNQHVSVAGSAIPITSLDGPNNLRQTSCSFIVATIQAESLQQCLAGCGPVTLAAGRKTNSVTRVLSPGCCHQGAVTRVLLHCDFCTGSVTNASVYSLKYCTHIKI